MSSASHRRLVCLALAAFTIPVGLTWRMAPLHLPPLAWKYGGSALWAVTLYWIIAALLPASRPLRLAFVACAVAAAVELSRLHHSPAEDAFRLTLAGRLILGRIFALADILAYWLAIAATAALDTIIMSL